MSSRLDWLRKLPIIFWASAALAAMACLCVPSYVAGWDLNVYRIAMQVLRSGHDPYAAGIEARRVFFSQMALHPHAAPPYDYVYPPITLPLLRWLGRFPLALLGTIYWLLYIACGLTAILVGTGIAQPAEKRAFTLIAPAVPFFPGLLLHPDCLFSGNIAFVVSGLAFVTGAVGLRKGRLAWFYAVL